MTGTLFHGIPLSGKPSARDLMQRYRAAKSQARDSKFQLSIDEEHNATKSLVAALEVFPSANVINAARDASPRMSKAVIRVFHSRTARKINEMANNLNMPFLRVKEAARP